MPLDQTRLGLQESIIRNLGYPTATDLLQQGAALSGTPIDPQALMGARGKAPSTVSWLTPYLMQQKIDEAVAEINLRTLDFGANKPLTANVPATTASNGPQFVQLDSGFNTSNSQIDRVMSARWQTSGNTSFDPLKMTSLQELDRNGYDWRGATPSTPPIYLAVEAYELWLIPAASSAGLVSLTAVMGLIPPQHDNDTLQQLPYDLYPQFLYKATELVAATQMNDPVLKGYVEYYAPKAENAVKIIATTMNEMNQAYEPTVTVDLGRINRARR